MSKINISVISCGRSDFSHYLPIISLINSDSRFNLKIVVFGSHLSKFFGSTKDEITSKGFKIYKEIDTMLSSDSNESIASSMGITTLKFANYWKNNSKDIILVLGDRYEMFSAVSASVPYNMRIAHIHGGERTEGAIDDKFRDSISRFSSIHFTSTESHKKRVIQILGEDYSRNVFNFGAPCIDNLKNLKLLSKKEFIKKFDLQFSDDQGFILATIHPETIKEKNNKLIMSLTKEFVRSVSSQIIFTLPNNDSGNYFIRKSLHNLKNECENVILKESLGAIGYYSAMKYSSYIFGNSSSGIIEAAQFKKYVINIGERQKGRESGDNVFHVMNNSELITSIKRINKTMDYKGSNIFYNGGASEKIVKKLITLNNE